MPLESKSEYDATPTRHNAPSVEITHMRDTS